MESRTGWVGGPLRLIATVEFVHVVKSGPESYNLALCACPPPPCPCPPASMRRERRAMYLSMVREYEAAIFVSQTPHGQCYTTVAAGRPRSATSSGSTALQHRALQHRAPQNALLWTAKFPRCDARLARRSKTCKGDVIVDLVNMDVILSQQNLWQLHPTEARQERDLQTSRTLRAEATKNRRRRSKNNVPHPTAGLWPCKRQKRTRWSRWEGGRATDARRHMSSIGRDRKIFPAKPRKVAESPSP